MTILRSQIFNSKFEFQGVTRRIATTIVVAGSSIIIRDSVGYLDAAYLKSQDNKEEGMSTERDIEYKLRLNFLNIFLSFFGRRC